MAQAQTAVLQADPAQDKATAAKPSNVRWRIFAIVFALTVINLVDRVSLSIAMPPSPVNSSSRRACRG